MGWGWGGVGEGRRGGGRSVAMGFHLVLCNLLRTVMSGVHSSPAEIRMLLSPPKSSGFQVSWMSFHV